MSVLKKFIVLAGLGLSMLATSGCQTWIQEAGVTMPTGEWLLHPPQFFPATPAFPLNREMNTMRTAYQNLPPDGQ
jgi:hypothetical protein